MGLRRRHLLLLFLVVAGGAAALCADVLRFDAVFPMLSRPKRAIPKFLLSDFHPKFGRRQVQPEPEINRPSAVDHQLNLDVATCVILRPVL